PPPIPLRQNSPKPAEVEVQCPDGAPKWLRKNLANLRLVKLGQKYNLLLSAFVALETTYGDQTPSTKRTALSSSKRPLEVGKWIGVGRRANRVIDDLPAFQKQWGIWWNSLQPEWRGDGERKG
ncbi:hypothetical protein FB45DRAFT_701104, partial [Roridomyces roridus]